MRSFCFARIMFCAGISLAGCSHEVRPDDMSAEAHRAAAQKEHQAAQREMVKAALDSPGRDPANLGTILEPEVNSNLAFDPALQARSLDRRAQEHEQAASELENREAVECKSVPDSERYVCPSLGSVTNVQEVPGGVRLRLAVGTRADELLSALQCMNAYSRAHGLAESLGCVSSLKGVVFRETSDAHAIDVLGENSKATQEIRKAVRMGGSA